MAKLQASIRHYVLQSPHTLIASWVGEAQAPDLTPSQFSRNLWYLYINTAQHPIFPRVYSWLKQVFSNDLLLSEPHPQANIFHDLQPHCPCHCFAKKKKCGEPSTRTLQNLKGTRVFMHMEVPQECLR